MNNHTHELHDLHLTYDLEKIKMKIENMTKQNQIEILKILKNHNNIKLNENKSGVFINLSFLPKIVLEELTKYIHYIDDQENSIRHLENVLDRVLLFLLPGFLLGEDNSDH